MRVTVKAVPGTRLDNPDREPLKGFFGFVCDETGDEIAGGGFSTCKTQACRWAIHKHRALQEKS